VRALRLLFLLGALTPLRAEEVISWPAAVEEAKAHNPGLAAAAASARSAQSSYRGSFSDFLPQVTGSGSASKSDGDAGFGGSADSRYSVGLTARQSLFAGLRTQAGTRAARANYDAARAGLDQTAAQLHFNLKNAFAELLEAQENIVLTRAIAQRRKQNLDLVELRYEGGREHKGSFLRIRASWRQAAYDVARAERAVRVARRRMAGLLGRDAFSLFSASGTFDLAPPVAPDFEGLAKNVPAVREAEARARAARAALAVARGQFLPDLDVSASATQSDDQWPPKNDSYSVGLTLSVPIFSGGRRYYDWRSAQADDARARLNFQDARLQTLLDLEDAHAAYMDAVERADVQREFLDAAETRAQIARGQYTSGLLTFDNWDIIENDLISSQTTLLSSRRNALTAQAAWERAQGKGLTP